MRYIISLLGAVIVVALLVWLGAALLNATRAAPVDSVIVEANQL